jgi:hypothetical protein
VLIFMFKSNNNFDGHDDKIGVTALAGNTHSNNKFIQFKQVQINLNIGLVLNDISGSDEVRFDRIGSLLKYTKYKVFKSYDSPVSSVDRIFNNYPDSSNIYKSKNDLRDKIVGYFSHKKEWLKFITLTFDPKKNVNKNLYSLGDAHKCIRLLIKKLQSKYGFFRYLWVAERHKSGVIHYHMLCYLPYIDKDLFHSFWSYGMSRIEAPHEIHNMQRYMTKISNEMTKYLSKSEANHSFKGHKRFACSKDVRKISIYSGAFEAISKYLVNYEPVDTGSFSFSNPFMSGITYWFMFADEFT